MKIEQQAKQLFAPLISSSGTNKHLAKVFEGDIHHALRACVAFSDKAMAVAVAASMLAINGNVRPTERRDRLRRMIVLGSGLPHEPSSAIMLSEIDALMQGDSSFLPNMQRYARQLTTRYVIKCVDIDSMFGILLSGFAPGILLSILAEREVNDSWANWSSNNNCHMNYMAGQILGDVFPQFSNMQPRDFAMQYAPEYLAISEGYADLAEAQQAWGGTAATAPVSPTNLAATNVITNTGVTNMANAAPTITINAAVKPIIDGVLQSSGTGLTIDTIIEQLNEKTAMAEAIKASDKEINDLKTKLAQARNAASTSLTATIQPAAQGIPAGKVEMTSCDKLFPELAGLKLNVPQFTWDHAHPDVPEVNPNYIFRKEMLLKAVRCLARGENFWLQGHTGSGKTTFVEQIAARMGWPVLRIAFDSNVDRSELVGRMQLKPDGKGGTASEWLPGVLERAMTGGYILLCDEMDAGHPNSLYTIQPILEGKALTLLEDGGRMVQRSNAFRICATGNTTGNGDPSGMYPACRILSAATLDRFQEFIHVPYMTVDEEKKLIASVAPTLNKKLIEQLAKFSEEMRQAFVRMETPISYSPRRSMSFARQIEDLDAIGIKDQPTAISLAFRSKLYDAAPEEHRQRITEIANNVFAGGINVNVTI